MTLTQNTLTPDVISSWTESERMENLYRILRYVMDRQSESTLTIPSSEPGQTIMRVSEFPILSITPAGSRFPEIRELSKKARDPKNRMTIDEIGSDDL